MRRILITDVCVCILLLAAVSMAQPPSTVTSGLVELRNQFLSQELITAKRNTTLFSPGEPPRIVWRDLQTVRDLGCSAPLRVRWFDADLNEETTPTRPGRWCAWIESTAPNGTPLYRSLTFFCKPPGFLGIPLPEFQKPIDVFSSPTLSTESKAATRKELEELVRRGASDGLNNSQYAAAIAAALCNEANTSASLIRIRALDNQFHLAVKLKALGGEKKVRRLPVPKIFDGPSAPVLREGTLEDAAVIPGTREKLDAICRDWLAEGGEPFSMIAAHNGVVVLHAAYGVDKASGKPLTTDFRSDVASLTKSIVGVLAARFVEEGLFNPGDPVSVVFPDFPTSGPLVSHVPTFRQLLMHTAGLNGHGDWGGVNNPNFENLILNKLDAVEPGRKYEYSGTGFSLLGKAMEMQTGRTAEQLINEGLCEPLGIGFMPVNDYGSGAEPTAWQLAAIGQIIANGGRYGNKVIMSENTWREYLPEPYQKRMPWEKEPEWYGFGIGRKLDVKEGKTANSENPEDLVFGTTEVYGHGSISFCLLRVDRKHNLVVAQIRKAAGKNYGDWARKFCQTLADSVRH